MNTKPEHNASPRETTGNTFTVLAAGFLTGSMLLLSICVMMGYEAQSLAQLIGPDYFSGTSVSHGQTHY